MPIIQKRRVLTVFVQATSYASDTQQIFSMCRAPTYLPMCEMGDSVIPSKLFLKEDAATERTDQPTRTGTHKALRNLMRMRTVTHWSEVALQAAFVTSSQIKTIT